MNAKEIKERIKKEIDLSHLPEVLQVERIQNIAYNVMKKLATEIMKRIPANRLEEFNMVSEAGNAEETKKFLSTYIRDIDAFTEDIILKELETFKENNN